MRATLKAIAEHLQDGLDEWRDVEPTKRRRIVVHRDYAYGVAAPYVVLQSRSLGHVEAMIGGPAVDEAGGAFTATSVNATSDGARLVADLVRGILSPDLGVARIDGDTVVVETVWDGALGPVSVDRDVTLPNSNTHPALVIEEFRFSSHVAVESS